VRGLAAFRSPVPRTQRSSGSPRSPGPSRWPCSRMATSTSPVWAGSASVSHEPTALGSPSGRPTPRSWCSSPARTSPHLQLPSVTGWWARPDGGRL